MKKHCAILFYGILPPDNWNPPWEESGTNWKDCIASRHGLHLPDSKFKGNEDVYQEYWKKREDIIKKLGVTVEICGSEKNVKYTFAVKDSIFYAAQEFPEIIDINLFKEKNPVWDGILKKFCEILDVKPDTKFSWILTSFADFN